MLLVLEALPLAPAEEADAAAALAGGRRGVGHRGEHGEALVEALERDQAVLVHAHVLQQGAHLAQGEAGGVGGKEVAASTVLSAKAAPDWWLTRLTRATG